MIEALRTPDDRFSDLPDFPWAPQYRDDLPGYEGLRLAYVSAGDDAATHTVLCLHGQPTWGFLYRKMVPVFTAAGHRVIVPDLFGFGRSDKPVDDAVYTFDFHRDALLAFVDALELEDVTLVVHDWGGLLGLTLPVDRPRLARRLVVCNTALATGTVPLGKGFEDWREWARQHPDMAVDRLMGRACPQLSEAERAAYAAPFPDVKYKAGVRRFPDLVADRPDAPGAATARRALAWWREQWQGESFMAVGMQDTVLGPPAMAALRKVIRGCPEPLEIADAGHFVPEWGDTIARAALAAFGD